MESTTKLYSLNYTNANTYLFAFVFIVGNVVLPQLCHLVHLCGPAMLPIYFFTLIGAYKYGFKVGMLTSVLSPLVNSFLFGRPAVTIRKITSSAVVGTVMVYQVVGSLIEWARVG